MIEQRRIDHAEAIRIIALVEGHYLNLKGNPEIANRKARDLTGIRSENPMKNVFPGLKGGNLIEPVPGKEQGGGAAWRKAQRQPVEVEPVVGGTSQ